MGLVTSQWFFECAKNQLPKMVKEYYKDKKVKRIQFYSDFYDFNGEYPYIKNNLVFYPLTIIFYNNSYDVLWINWTCSGRKIEELHKLPFCPLEDIIFNICKDEDVETQFKDDIKGKKLVYFKNKSKALPVINIKDPVGIGKVNQAFVDVLVEHIEKSLNDTWNISLNNRWDVYLEATENTVKFGDKKYRKVTFTDSIGWAIWCGVMWQEDFDVNDFISYDDVTFYLVDSIPGEKHISSVNELLDFIKERTIVYIQNQKKPIKWGIGIWTKVQPGDEEVEVKGNK